MPIIKVIAMFNNRPKDVITPSEVARVHGISTGQASVELSRVERLGVCRKIGRGKYILFNSELALEMLNNKTQHDTTTHNMGDSTPPSLVRLHRVWFKAKVQNVPKVEARNLTKQDETDAWRGWRTGPGSNFYQKKILLEDLGISALIRYAEGTKHRTLTVLMDSVMVTDDSLEGHMDRCRTGAQESLKVLCKEGFTVGLLELTCDAHFAIPLPVSHGWRLPPPGKIQINEYWWIDSSHGWPEMETHLQEQCKRILGLPDRMKGLESSVQGLPDGIRIALREELLGILNGNGKKPQAPPPEPTGQEVGNV